MCLVAACASDGMNLPGDAGVDDALDEGPDAGDQPEPVPSISDEPPALCSGSHPAGYYQFLDDICHAKVQPSRTDREQACPIIYLDGSGYRPGSDPIVVEDVLDGVVPAELDVAVIEIRRVNGVPRYRYLSNGSAEHAVQPWSSTKWLAAANAGARLRQASGGAVGLTASVDGRRLGDLVTSIANYDDNPYSSNSLGRYFHNIGGRTRANALIHSWLGRPTSETFGGNYGENAPGLGYTFIEPGGERVTVVADQSSGLANHLSMLTLAEALKRTVLLREEPAQQLPGLTWPDARTLLFGADSSATYGEWGGLSADDAIYMQSAHDWSYIERRSQGRWRIFSKLGLGTDGQFVNVAYACLPVLDSNGRPIAGRGKELVIAAHLAAGGSDFAARDRLLARAFRAIVTRVVDGSL